VKKCEENRGFTLIEMLVVISVVIFLLGMGVTVLSRLSYKWGYEANVMRAQSIIRSARNFSLTNEAASEVHIIPRENRVFTLGEKTVAQWHFEQASDEVVGAFGITGQVYNANLVTGKVGNGLEFGTTDGLDLMDSYVDCGNLPRYTPPSGVIFDVWIYPGDFRGSRYKSLIGQIVEESEDESELDEEELEEEARRKAQSEMTLRRKFKEERRFSIIYKEGSYFINITENYALEFGFAEPTSFFPLRTVDNVLTPNMWNHIILRYSGTLQSPPDKVRIYVNNVPLTVFFLEDAGPDYKMESIANLEARKSEDMLPDRLNQTESNLFISDSEWSFYGIIDEVRIGAILDPEIEKLDAAYLMGYPQVIYFDSQGRLDPERHEGDISVKLTENPLYRAPDPSKETDEFISRGGGVTGLISAEEALKDLNKKQATIDIFKHAIITINRYGRMTLEEVVEEEPREE